MTREASRRQVLGVLGAGLVGASTGRTGASSALTSDRRDSETGGVRERDGSQSDTISVTGGVTVDDDRETMEYTTTFALPSQLSELSIVNEALNLPYWSVETTAGVEQTAPDTFVWRGGPDPGLRFDLALDAAQFQDSGFGYTAGDTAFAVLPESDLSWQYDSDAPDPEVTRGPVTFDGAGIATTDLMFAGTFDSYERTVAGTDIVLVVPDGVERRIDTATTLDVVEAGERALGGLRFDHTEKGLFVVPRGTLEMDYAGRTVGASLYVRESSWDLNRIESIPVHEFAHTVFGLFGAEEMYWLREGVAEYYGYLVSLNAGIGDTAEFFEAVETSVLYEDAVLSDTEQMRQRPADYQKGAHVLAALDAQIRTRTAHEKTLLSVFRTGADLSTYNEFRSAVRQVTDDPEMGNWVGQYVKTEALPAIPRNPELFTLPGVTVDALPTPSPPATATPVSTPAPTTATASATQPPPTQANTSASAGEESRDGVGPGFTTLGGLAGVAGVGYLLGRGDDEN